LLNYGIFNDHARNYMASNLDHTVNSAGLSVGLSFMWCTVKQFSVKQNRKSHHSSSALSQSILTTLYCIYLSVSFVVFQWAGLCVTCFLFAASQPLIWEAVSLSFDLMSNVIVSPVGSHEIGIDHFLPIVRQLSIDVTTARMPRDASRDVSRDTWHSQGSQLHRLSVQQQVVSSPIHQSKRLYQLQRLSS
jgi:hypothetical protein